MSAPDPDTSLLARLLELPEAEREAFLRRACAVDPRLSPGLHVATSSNESHLSQFAVVSAFEAALNLAIPENSGAKIGPYKLLQKIGEGGFGVVWMAEQLEPIKRRVALKIVKVGMDTEEVIARFEAERQALALMEHANIAHVYDAGATDAGRPYFVMELVRGVAITHYCDENRLSAEARLRLFVTVCQAVQHAHQKGVIHRDLKPSNILVTLHDGVPVPKIIDFGIAKATSAQLTEKTFFTQFNAFIGTPAYTSPEQMEMSGLDIDTRSDIYSLGVLLYELLTGQPPFDSKALVRSGLEARRRAVREADPPRPSHFLATLNAVARTSVAQQRGTDATRLSLLLRGDLDWIAMRCLEKDRTRRYASAASLASDVERHLRDDLVEARPPGRIYQIKKFIRRHKVSVFSGATVAVSLIAGLVASSTLLVRERNAHRRAVTAEIKEGELRRQAQVNEASEVKRAARTALESANRNLTDGRFADGVALRAFADGRVADGLAYLVYAARKDPGNRTLGPRLASALATHNFLLPEGPPFECGSRVLAVHYTRAGGLIYVGTEDGVFRAFDANSGRLQVELRLGRPILRGGWHFCRDNDAVFVARFADNTFGVFDVKSGQPRWPPRALKEPSGPDVEITAGGRVGMSDDGRWAYVATNYQLEIWDAATGGLLLHYESENGGRIGSCTFVREGAQVAITVGRRVMLWTLPDAVPIATPISMGDRDLPALDGFPADQRDSLTTVNFSPDARYAALSTATSGIGVFDAATGNRLQTLRIPAGQFAFASVVFASKSRVFGAGRRVSGSWDVLTGTFRELPIAPAADVRSKSFDASGSRILTTAADGLIRICDLISGKVVAEPIRLQGACATLAPDGMHLVTGTPAGTVQRFRIGRGKAVPLTLAREPLQKPLVFFPQSPTRLLWMKNTHAVVLDAASGRETSGGFVYPTRILRLNSATFEPAVRQDMKFMVMPTEAGMQAWEISDGGVKHVALLEQLVLEPTVQHACTFSPRGDLVAVGTGLPGTLRVGVWNLRTGRLAGPIYTAPSTIPFVTIHFHPDGQRYTLGTMRGLSMVLDVATARPTASFATPAFVPILSLALSPDGTRVVTSNARNETRVWDAATGQPLGPPRDTTDTRDWGTTRYSPDGRWFATCGRNAAQLWDGTSGVPVGEPIPAGGSMVRFSPDSRGLATSGETGNTRLWDVPTGQPFTEPMEHGSSNVGFPAFSPDGRFLRLEHDGRFYIWSLPTRLPDGAAVPEWLARLATVCARRTVNEAGELIDVSDATARYHQVCDDIAALANDAPLAEWGRWVVNDRADRPIAPGFTITRAARDDLGAVPAAERPEHP